VSRAEKLLEFAAGVSLGTSLPFIHRNPAPMKSSWFDKSRGQMVELYGTKVSRDTDNLEVFLNTVDTMIGTLYRYNVTVSPATFQQMVNFARTEGIESLSFPEQWVVVKP
jgi:hypothetical protein